ncbi:hypothetical protein KSF_108070 [Reticulibacter mediterranei]|uniref:Uncharacterized protein n=1 Tax=Reticulibacter mediterranei TaxID=2778369 RepID=A0A8J3IZC7_9CHLR|nr:hypothetical protein [Reticulibacter mediterranei]GHP00760.1 hypothetical protein KSF_108070 [Reticulibacter mediterranei]
MQTLNNLDNIIRQLQTHAAAIGITLGGLMIGIYAMLIMLSHDSSAMANRNRWEHLQKVLICAGIIAGTGAFMQFAQGLGKML